MHPHLKLLNHDEFANSGLDLLGRRFAKTTMGIVIYNTSRNMMLLQARNTSALLGASRQRNVMSVHRPRVVVKALPEASVTPSTADRSSVLLKNAAMLITPYVLPIGAAYAAPAAAVVAEVRTNPKSYIS